MDDRVADLKKREGRLFEKRGSLLSLWQNIADNFYVERADFTVTRYTGTEFAEGLMSGFPLMVRRDLGNMWSSILRNGEWFDVSINYENVLTNQGRQWLEFATRTQRSAMYDRVTNFVRATKEGDHDVSAFGQCVISVELNSTATALSYRCWHLRDVAWCENDDGQIDTVVLKWKPTAKDLIAKFRGKVSQKVKELAEKDPYCDVEVRRWVIPADSYEKKFGNRGREMPFVSVYYEADSGYLLEEIGTYYNPFCIPRWQTVSGSQYSYSPATTIALPDARLLQAMTLTLLEAGEKSVNPPMLAVEQMIRGDISLYSGGITWVDAKYDTSGKLADVMHPMTIDKTGLNFGREMLQDTRSLLTEAFFLNKLSLPPADTSKMTAYEVSERVKEYIRQATPIIEPMVTDYNGQLCEKTFAVLFRSGAFGPPQDIPEELQGQDIRFKFKSPIQDAEDSRDAAIFQQAKALIAESVALDPSSQFILDAPAALREALSGLGVPAKWMHSEEQVQQAAAAQNQQAQTQQLLATLQQGGTAAKTIGEAQAAFQ